MSNGVRLLVDYGVVHRHNLNRLRLDALLITHGHPDHYIWSREDFRTRVPVYLTKDTLTCGRYGPRNVEVVRPGDTIEVGRLACEAYSVVHSIRCPAVGYRVRTPDGVLVYNPDLVDIVDRDRVLEGVDCYIGDGSCIRANLVRRKGESLFGHARITTQLKWCRDHGIARAVFTHLGRETIRREEEFAEKHSDVTLAYDGMALEL